MSLIPGATSSPATMVDGILGVFDGTSASAGNVGEVIESIVTGVTISGGTNMTSISLTNGDWELNGAVVFIPTTTSNPSYLLASFTRTSHVYNAATFAAPNSNGEVFHQFAWNGTTTISDKFAITIPPIRVSVSGGSVTQYLVAGGSYTNSLTANGYIHARRIR